MADASKEVLLKLKVYRMHF